MSRSFLIFLCAIVSLVSVSSLAHAQFISQVPGSAEPRMQLSGEHFQIFESGTYFSSLLPGSSLSQYGVIGVDLGYPVVYPDKIIFLFGDTLSAYGDSNGNFSLSAGSGGDDSIGYIPNVDLSACHDIANADSAIQGGNTNPEVSSQNCPTPAFYRNPSRGSKDHAFASIKIAGLQPGEGTGEFLTPSGAFDYNDRLYMFYVTKIQAATPHFALQSILAKSNQSNTAWSDSNPPSFTRLYTVSTHPTVGDPSNPPAEEAANGKFMFNPLVALDAVTIESANLRSGLPASLQNAAKVVFVFGSSWRYNRSNLYLAAFSAGDVEGGTLKWFYYSGNSGGANTWSQDEKAAAPLLANTPNIGNHSVIWNSALKTFILMSGNVVARFAPAPWGPWSDATVVLGPQSTWAKRLIHHPGTDPIVRSILSVTNPKTNQAVDLDQDSTGIPYGPYLLDKSSQNADGSVTVYFTMSTWDPYQVFLVSTTLTSGVQGGSVVSAASYNASAVAPASIASIFAGGLAASTVSAPTTNLPTSLGGESVTVQDSTGVSRTAGLYFLSPNQINFVVPPQTALGAATISVIQNGKSILSVPVQVANTAPSLFTANATGTGVAAGFLVTVDSSGRAQRQPLFSCASGAGTCGAAPLDLSNAPGGAYFELYATGIRNGGGPGAAVVNLSGVNAPVTYVGSQNQFPGMDQINVQIPLELRGRGETNLTVFINGQAANAVRVAFK